MIQTESDFSGVKEVKSVKINGQIKGIILQKKKI